MMSDDEDAAGESTSACITQRHYRRSLKSAIRATLCRRRNTLLPAHMRRIIASVLRSNEPAFRAVGMRALLLGPRGTRQGRRGGLGPIISTLGRISAAGESQRNQFHAAHVLGSRFWLLKAPCRALGATVQGEKGKAPYWRVANLGMACILLLFRRAFWRPAQCSVGAGSLPCVPGYYTKIRSWVLAAMGPYLDAPEASQQCSAWHWVFETFLLVLRSGAETLGPVLGARGGGARIGCLGAEWNASPQRAVTSATMRWPWTLARPAKRLHFPLPGAPPTGTMDCIPGHLPAKPQCPQIQERLSRTCHSCDCCCWNKESSMVSNSGYAFRCRTLAAMYDGDLERIEPLVLGARGVGDQNANSLTSTWRHFEGGLGNWLVQVVLLRTLVRCVGDTPRNRARMRNLLPYIRSMVDIVGMATHRSMHFVDAISESLVSDKSVGIGRAATAIAPDRIRSTPSRTSTKFGDAPSRVIKPTHGNIARLHPEIIVALSGFVSKWYPQVPDEYISYLPALMNGQCDGTEDIQATDSERESAYGHLRRTVCGNGSEPRSLHSGYVFRRKLALQKKHNSLVAVHPEPPPPPCSSAQRESNALEATPGNVLVSEGPGAFCRHCTSHDLLMKGRKCTKECAYGSYGKDVTRVASSGFAMILGSTLRALRLSRGPSDTEGCHQHCIDPLDQKGWRNLVPGFSLSFHLRGRAVKFAGPSYRTTLHLTNRSAKKKNPFMLHVSPSNYFRVVPAFGVLDPQSTCTIIAEFTPCDLDPNTISKCIRGFIRVRSEDGFACERVDLVGHNTPLLRVYDSHIAFGFCPVNHVRSLPLYVENVGLVPSNCAVHFQSSGPFRASPTQCLLQTGEMKRFEVLFEPRVEGPVSGVLVVRGMGTEAYEVRISGTGGQSLVVLDDSIDFGPTDVWEPQYMPPHTKTVLAMPSSDTLSPVRGMVNQYVKVLRLQNVGTCHLPVSFRASSNEIVAGDICIQPGMTEISVELRPAQPGPWSGSLTINAPNAEPSVVLLRSFVGPLVGFPVGPEVFFPCARPNETKTLRLPIVNNCSHLVKFRICGHEVSSFIPSLFCPLLSFSPDQIRPTKSLCTVCDSRNCSSSIVVYASNCVRTL